jgi:lysozyme
MIDSALIKRVSLSILSFSAAGLVWLSTGEGYVSVASAPVKGDVATYGFGSTGADIHNGDKINPVQALQRELRDVQNTEAGVRACLGDVPLSQNEYDFIVHFSYNIGVSKFCQSTMAKKFKSLDYGGACKEVLRYTYFQGHDCNVDPWKKECGGLVTRRQDEYRHCIGKS